MRIVNEGESRALSTTVLCPETESRYLILVGFVEVGKLVAEFVFRDVGAVRVEDVTNDRFEPNS